jgi:hypothetical protein
VAQFNADMKKCRYCGKYIKKEEVVCEFCGFNCETGTLDPTFQQGAKERLKPKGAITNQLKAIFAAALFIIAVIVLYNVIQGRSAYLKSFTSNIMQRLKNLKLNAITKNSSSGSRANPKTISSLAKVTYPDKTIIEKRKKFLTLEGIAYVSGDKRFVTINGEILTEGDTIARVIVSKINERSVELLMPGGETKMLEISQSIPIPAK